VKQPMTRYNYRLRPINLRYCCRVSWSFQQLRKTSHILNARSRSMKCHIVTLNLT